VTDFARPRVERTRREAIKRGLALASLAGVASSGKIIIDGSPAGASEQSSDQPSQQPPQQPSGGNSDAGSRGRSFGGRNLDVSGPGIARGVLPDRGDHLMISGDLLDASGAAIGALFGTYLQLLPFGQAGAGDPTSLQEHTFTFLDGTIHGRGLAVANIDAKNAFAIVGGTGRYTNITGSYTALQRFSSLGGDGSAHFDLTTNPEASHNGGS
jgi:hypothetical protein